MSVTAPCRGGLGVGGDPLIIEAEGVCGRDNFTVEMSYVVAVLTGIKNRDSFSVWELFSKRD